MALDFKDMRQILFEEDIENERKEKERQKRELQERKIKLQERKIELQERKQRQQDKETERPKASNAGIIFAIVAAVLVFLQAVMCFLLVWKS